MRQASIKKQNLYTRLADFAGEVRANLGYEYGEALDAYARAKGKDWGEELAADFWAGRDDRFKDEFGKHWGAHLRQIRNHPKWGHAFYAALNGDF